MSNPLVSVIVPVYKVERYLPRCIESILRQNYTNFELILVDDGTPDRSGIICDRYAECDSRIKVIHKENGGVSSARNAGIDAAQGEWITFVDSDDWVSDDYLKVLIDPLEEGDFELIVGRLEWRYITIGSRELPQKLIELEKHNEEDVIYICESMEFHGPCYKLFSRKKIVQYNLKFPEGIATAEDTIFVNSYLTCCARIYMTGKTIYYYNRFNDNSVTSLPRYFEQRPVWDTQFIGSYIELLDRFKISKAIKNKITSQKAFARYYININSIVSVFKNEDAINKISKVSNFYTKFINENDLMGCLKNEEQRQIFQLLKKNDFSAMYPILNEKKQNKIIFSVKFFIKKLICRFIEKYRDGLVKFKF